MTVSATSDIFFDPYDAGLIADPYPMFTRLREENPLYYNEQHDFYALSRFSDVNDCLADPATYSSARGNVLELIKANTDIPPGLLVMEDPPRHDIHRKLVARMFTPRKISQLEPMVREFCARSLDPLTGNAGFDFIADLGAPMPMRVICMLLGIPEEIQESVRDHSNAQVGTEDGRPMEAASSGLDDGQIFAEYINWREKHPSDDIVTELLNVEFEDETGTVRRLTRDELLMYVNVVAGAGNETTTRLIGWAGKVLAEHPEQRHELVQDRGLIPRTIEELLRLEPPAPHAARYVTRDVEHHGHKVAAGSTMMLLIGAANHDHRRFPPDGDIFDIHRPPQPHLGFGIGAHFCLGAALARLEGRIALDELLQRFPEWNVDLTTARMSTTSTVRGWESMPATLP